jgi:adenosylcobinamide-GDP ribazoletransferase
MSSDGADQAPAEKSSADKNAAAKNPADANSGEINPPEKNPPTKVQLAKTPLSQFALATSYITILPLSKWVKIEGDVGDEEILAGLTKYLPAVGMLVGLILCSLSFLLSLGPEAGIRPVLNAVIITIAWLITTGALHFDGLMDTADGVFSHRDQKRMLEIMQDSRVGNFGAITGFAVFALKVSAMAAMSPQALPLALFLIPMWARFVEAYAIGHYSYAKPEGKGKVWHDSTKVPRDLVIAVILPLFLTLVLGIVVSESAYVTAIFATFSGLATGQYLNAKLGGHTGDTYGAVVEVSETLTLVGLALLGNNLFR